MPTHVVRSVEELRLVLREADLSEDQDFVLSEDMPLHEAKRVWSVVSDIGGYGVLSNAEVLTGKDVAFGFVNQKLAELRRLVDNSDTKLEELVDSADHLDAILAAGGPGIPPAYEPQAFQEDAASYIDTDEPIAEEDMEQHIYLLTSLLHSRSPGSPAPEGYRSADALKDREAMEQSALMQLNSEILKVKRNALANLRNDLAKGILELEAKFLYAPTHLGCGSGDYSRFMELSMLPAERKGHTWWKDLQTRVENPAIMPHQIVYCFS